MLFIWLSAFISSILNGYFSKFHIISHLLRIYFYEMYITILKKMCTQIVWKSEIILFVKINCLVDKEKRFSFRLNDIWHYPNKWIPFTHHPKLTTQPIFWKYIFSVRISSKFPIYSKIHWECWGYIMISKILLQEVMWKYDYILEIHNIRGILNVWMLMLMSDQKHRTSTRLCIS